MASINAQEVERYSEKLGADQSDLASLTQTMIDIRSLQQYLCTEYDQCE